uniref:Uncharacterized protein n=1 Tax=Callorhinchus milii TaxID=7868 RepID=A0A4W3JMQ8_CALMI
DNLLDSEYSVYLSPSDQHRCLFLHCLGSEGGSLSPFIKQYEGLSYSRNAVHQQHQRVRRSVCKEDALIHLQFSTRQRQFRLRLKRDSSMFTEDFIMKGKNLPGNGDLSHIYSGELQDYGLKVRTMRNFWPLKESHEVCKYPRCLIFN